MARYAHKQISTTDPLQSVDYKFGFSYSTAKYSHIIKPGLRENVIQEISHLKNEPTWMLDLRLKAFKQFEAKELPKWGADLSQINFEQIRYYLRPSDKQASNWADVPAEVKETFEKLGIPAAEREVLAGVKAQYDSEVVYGSLKKTWEKDGVIFLSMDEGLKQHPDLVKEYFGKIIQSGDNKFSALNTAAWSGGSFIYIPKGVQVNLPLQTYFRINASNAGQFERTLIIVDEGASVHYVEGCTAPNFSANSLHAAVVEIMVKKGARCQYTTIQNWSTNVYNLVTKRMRVEEEGIGEWVDGNLGSKLTMKYPSVYLVGRKARGEVLSIAYAGPGQHQDAGGKAIHLASETTSRITSKSISKGGGRTSYRGLLHVIPSAKNVKSKVVCDALLLDETSRSDTYPTMKIHSQDVQIEHEATVSKIGEEQLFYLQSRGLTKELAEAMIVNGFIEPIVKELPLEYAVEMNRLIELQMEGSVG